MIAVSWEMLMPPNARRTTERAKRDARRARRRSPAGGSLQPRILATAWKQIAEDGAPALSLRAIARELRITAPAIYNYYPDRDALVTALVIDAYTAFGDAQLAAVEALPESDLLGRLRAAGNAYRAWAVANPERYQLIFGTPIPRYDPPLEQIQPVASRSLRALLGVLEGLRRRDQLRTVGETDLSPEKLAIFERWQAYAGEVGIQSVAVALLIWARVHGLVSLEIGKNLPPFGPTPEELYEYELKAIAREFVK
jgi:AcrR family transcriptional regulator